MSKFLLQGAAVGLLCTTWALFALRPSSAEEPPLVERPSPRQLEAPTYLEKAPAEAFELPPVEDRAIAPAASGPTLEVRAITFIGNSAIATSELERLAAPYVGRPLTRAELEQLRQSVSRLYLERGYVNSGAILADDFYLDGTVRLQIIEGRVEELRLNGMQRLNDAYVRERLLPRDELLNVGVLQERFQLLLADPLFAKINARLQPGSRLGMARLDLDVTRARPWELALLANNYRSPSVGAEAVGITGRVRNLTGRGDALDALAQGGQGSNDRYGIGWSVPLTPRLLAHARYDSGNSAVLEEPLDVLDIKSTLESRELGVDYAVIETTRRRLSLGVSFIHRENHTEVLGEPFSFVPGESSGTSKVNAWRFDQDFVQRWQKQALALRSTFTWGRTNTDDSAQNAVPPDRFFFWLGQAQFTRRLLENGGDLLLRANVQLSPDRLVPLERFSIGGIATLRGYRENQVVRDRGFNVSAEFRYPLLEQTASRQRLTVIPFVDYGEAHNKGEAKQELASIGLGLSYQYRGFNAELFYGEPLIDPDVETSGDLQDHGIHFQLRYDF